MSRRQFIAGLASASAACALKRPAQAQAPAKPNIIFIMADDLGYGDLGCYGQKNVLTPAIDALAKESMRFTDCHTGASVCAPSRCVLMTGRHTGHGTVRGNHGINAPKHDGQEGRIPLRREDVTVAEVLKRVGYATGITGKWGLGEPGSTGLPNDHGFDEWLGYLNQDHAPDYYTDYLWRNKERMPIPENENGKRGRYTHDMFTEFALDFIRAHREGPFFLYVPYTIPHQKLEVPSLAPYEDKPWDEDEKIFAAMVTRMDRDAGRISALLDELGIADNTLLFFCSDNGSPYIWPGLFDSNGPLREKKGTVYEGGVRTAMIARWPGHIPAGSVSHLPWYFADVLPTLAEAAGAETPAELDGVSVLPTLLGHEQDLSGRFMYWEQSKSKKLTQAARRGDWKAVRHGRNGRIELYNLAEDLSETRDVAAQHPELVSEFKAKFASARTPSPYRPVEGD